MIDLHVHSTRSDGTFTPSELVDYAIEKKLTAFALTDHDTVEGLDEAVLHARNLKEQGVKDVPDVIPGIEFSTEYEGKDIHILGLYIDYNGPVFQKYLSDFISSRELRNEKMCKRFAEDGFDISYEALKSAFPGAVITRAHFARYLMEKGYTKSMKEAFDRYIGDRGPYYIPREKVTPKEAVSLILQADGVPILAHPILYHMSNERLEKLVSLLKDEGLMGIEAIYSTYSSSEERDVRKIAEKYHLLLSGGSDFHGTNKTDIDLGIGTGHLYVPEDILVNINLCRKNLLFTDMDGTLLKDDKTISEAMRVGLHNASEQGHRIIFSSGRPLPSILNVVKKLDLNLKGLMILSFNGSLVYDYEKDDVIFSKKMDAKTIRKIETLGKQYGIYIQAFTENEIVTYQDSPELRLYTGRIQMPFLFVDSLADYLSDGTYKMQYVSENDHEKLVELQTILNDKFSDVCDAYFSNPQYLEIMPKGVSKGAALKITADYLSMPQSHTFAAGDAQNDIAMLKQAHTSIAMKNAEDNVKELADIVTQKDNDHDGLLEIIETYFQ